ncbi:hypothetical protein ACQEVM_08430 [Streptomyces sp. CA-243310]|uniref:hypothetical protein n=1 Tax=Streptomyces sp. CA-243310 TaxID=3240056 RepID=UPI003D93F6E4
MSGATRIPPAYVGGSVLVTGAGIISLQEAASNPALAAAGTIVVVGALGVAHALIHGATTVRRMIKTRATTWIQAVVNPQDQAATAPSGSGGEVIELIRQDPEAIPEPGRDG